MNEKTTELINKAKTDSLKINNTDKPLAKLTKE